MADGRGIEGNSAAIHTVSLYMCMDSDVCADKDFCDEPFSKSSLKSRVCVGISLVTARANAAHEIRLLRNKKLASGSGIALSSLCRKRQPWFRMSLGPVLSDTLSQEIGERIGHRFELLMQKAPAVVQDVLGAGSERHTFARNWRADRASL